MPDHQDPEAPARPDNSISFQVEGVSALEERYRAEFTRIVQDYGLRVYRAASEAEWLTRAKGVDVPEFNTQHFFDGERSVLGKGWSRRKTPWWYVVIEITQPLIWAFVGVSFSLVSLGWGWGMWGGIAIAVGGATLGLEKMHKWMAENR